MYANVLIEYPVKTLDKTFTYIIPKNLLNQIRVGMKVLVPFANRIINGFVTNIKETNDSEYELKEINKIVDEYFCLNEELMEMGSFLQSKTFNNLCYSINSYNYASAKRNKRKQHIRINY